MPDCVIVIPVYKAEMNESEKASLIQCLKVLNDYPICLLCPNSLDTSGYEKILSEHEYFIERLEDNHFQSVNSYSKLLLTKEFYENLNEYNYMLIYQLDAWVFENRLNYWIEQKYDYIGAPWFEGYDKSDIDSPFFPYAGNGGFSLRKIDSFIKVLSEKYTYILPFREIVTMYKKRKLISNILSIPLFVFKYFQQYFDNFCETTKYNEDYIFAKLVPDKFGWFKVATPDVALKFSFECQPERLYCINNNNLPFGCHAFEKYEFEFWSKFIKI